MPTIPYSTSMSQDSLKGVTNLDERVVLVSNKESGLELSISLRDALLNWVAYPSDDAKEKEHRLFAEVHQGGNPMVTGSLSSLPTPQRRKA